MATAKHTYSNSEITVIWQPDLCEHSTKCWRMLPEVFHPRERPWVKIANSTTEKIRSTVENCPSGALSYVMNIDLPHEESLNT